MEREKEKVIIYRENSKFYGTTPENYQARIRDKNKVLDFSSFKSFEQVEEYFRKYYPYVTVLRG